MDPLSKKYPFASPYNFALNTPIQAVGPDGRKVVFPSQEAANRIADDINIILNKRYGGDGVPVTFRAVPVLSVSDAGDIEVKNWTYQLETNSDFDWGQDKYTSAVFDQINREKTFVVKLKNPEDAGVAAHPLQKAKMQGFGGGYSRKDLNTIYVQSDLPAATEENSSNTTTMGGVVLHEAVNHFHNLGNTEGSDGLQENFNIPKSTGAAKNHAGDVQSDNLIKPSEQKSLDEKK